MSYSSLVFVDQSVVDYQTLVPGIATDTEVVLINSHQDGIKHITSQLQKNTHYSRSISR
jgi:hypothetical protein